jgi:isopenicillin N synthase-like dioxygenase
VCNLGDVLARLSGDRYVSTPHRVRNRSGAERLSFPFFLDPSWDAVVDPATGDTYADHILSRVRRVFPDLARSAVGDEVVPLHAELAPEGGGTGLGGA